jgi:hypothetical protein
MPWSRRLSAPITLKNGRSATTLNEVREMMLSVPVELRRGPAWHHAVRLLSDAAEDKAPVADVERLFLRALMGADLI